MQITELTATFIPEHPWRLPGDPEVMLRSALGKALFDMVCVRRDSDCAACPLHTICMIPAWLDRGRAGRQGVRMAVPRIPASPGGRVSATQPLTASLVLLAPPPAPGLLLHALTTMGSDGLGRDRVRHTLQRVEVTGRETVTVLEDGAHTGDWPAPGHLPHGPAHPEDLRGLRLHFKRRWVRKHPDHTPDDLIRDAINRFNSVHESADHSVTRSWPEPHGLRGRWVSQEYERRSVRSVRSGQTHDLSGVRGTLQLQSDAQPWVDLLAAVEVLGVGRKTSYGMGRYRIEWLWG